MGLRNKNSYELRAKANMDETPLYLNMSTSTTVQTIGSKQLILEQKDENAEKNTVIETVLASEEN